jgi:hypothetical protein
LRSKRSKPALNFQLLFISLIVGDCRFVDHDNRPEADTARKFNIYRKFKVVVLQLSSKLVKLQSFA